MAEAEDVLTEVARHATIFARDLWRRHRHSPEGAQPLAAMDVARRLDLLVHAVFDTSYAIRMAQPPVLPTLLSRVFRRVQYPWQQAAIPSTNGHSIWLPAESGMADDNLALERYRVVMLQQVMRARRGSPLLLGHADSPLHSDVYLLLEAYAADKALADLLPGTADSINRLRRDELHLRPQIHQFSRARQPLERFLRMLLQADCAVPLAQIPVFLTSTQSMDAVPEVIREFRLDFWGVGRKHLSDAPLLKNWWTGEIRPPPAQGNELVVATGHFDTQDDSRVTRSARLPRRPEIREALPDEDSEKENPGAWMIQADEPHQHAEDPLGLQRPTDRDEETSADEFGDLVSELSEARLVSTPERPKEVLLSDDPPNINSRRSGERTLPMNGPLTYPEWDHGSQSYRDPGVTVHLLPVKSGDQAWVDQTLATHQGMLATLRRQFEMLRARRVLLRRQYDGDDIDLDAYIDSYANYRAGNAMAESLYQVHRNQDRSVAISLLIDISGSTDGWVSRNHRIIDVEREALLLVCIALESMGEPFSVLAFSGEGPQGVTVRPIKDFKEHHSNETALKISALQPEQYTRTGAALRHATASLMQIQAAHRLLVLLSDGKPNDIDNYEGRYGVEDMRMAVTEAKLQGISPFCLTIDRHAANYLPGIFGNHQYALLPNPENLPGVLLAWMKRLIIH